MDSRREENRRIISLLMALISKPWPSSRAVHSRPNRRGARFLTRARSSQAWISMSSADAWDGSAYRAGNYALLSHCRAREDFQRILGVMRLNARWQPLTTRHSPYSHGPTELDSRGRGLRLPGLTCPLIAFRDPAPGQRMRAVPVWFRHGEVSATAGVSPGVSDVGAKPATVDGDAVSAGPAADLSRPPASGPGMCRFGPSPAGSAAAAPNTALFPRCTVSCAGCTGRCRASGPGGSTTTGRSRARQLTAHVPARTRRL